MKKIYMAISIVILILSGITLYNYVGDGKDSEKTVALNSQANLVSISRGFDHMICVDDVMIEVEGSVLKARSVDGKMHWSQKLQSKVSKIIRSGINVIVLDKENRLICLNKQGKILWQYKYNLIPIDIISDKFGYTLVEYKRNDISNIDVYNAKGIKAGTVPIENGYILSFTSSGTDNYTISILDTSADSIKSKVINYNQKGELIWAVNFDNKIVLKIAYGPNGNIYLVDEATIYKYRTDGKEVGKIELEDKIVSFDCSSEKIYALLKNKSKYKLALVNESMNKIEVIDINQAPNGLLGLENQAVLCYGDRIEGYNKNGEMSFTFQSTSDIKDIYLASGNTLFVVTNNKMDLLKYQ